MEIYADNMVIYYSSLRSLHVVYALISSMHVVNYLLEWNNWSVETKKIDKLDAVFCKNWSGNGRSEKSLLKILSAIK